MIIRNQKSLLRGLPPAEQAARTVLLSVAETTLSRIHPGRLVTEALSRHSFSRYRHIYVVGAGKAAVAMAEAVERALPVAAGAINAPRGGVKVSLRRIHCTHASHPLPDSAGVRGSRRILEIARKAGKGDLVISLFSGGGSALMPLPLDDISLAEKIKITERLMKAGATIHELNAVRKHLSQIKGGFLAKAIYPADCLNLVISDVVGDSLSVIASGPLCPDPTLFADAAAILKKYRLPVPTCIQRGQVETPKPDDRIFKSISSRILANHLTAAEEAKKAVESRGFKAVILETNLQGESRHKAAEILPKIKEKNTVYILTGETTVTVRGKGQGGRNQEFVLAALASLKKSGQTLAFLSLGTDGVDGFCPRKTAGAIASPSTLKKSLSPLPYLDRNDSYHFFQKTGGLLFTGPTGTNLGDLILLMRI